MRWSRVASEPALFFPKQLTVVFKQMLASHLMIFLYVLWGPSYLAMFFSVHIEAYLYTAPTVCIITSPEAITTISYLIHCLLFHSFASFTFTLALSLSLPLNTGHFSKYARLVRIPLLPIESGPPLSLPVIYFFIREHIPFIIKFHLHRPQAPVCDFPALSRLASPFLPPVVSRR